MILKRSGRPARVVIAASAIAAVLVAAACSTKSNGGGNNATHSGAGGVKVGPGVTDDTITLGALTDESGVFALLGTTVSQGAQLFFDQLNKKGGVCDRQIKINLKDGGYDVDKSVAFYKAMAPDVLGMEQLLGSPINAALKQNI